MSKSAKTVDQKQVRADLIHMVNRLICMARDGEYASKDFTKLYDKFERMLGHYVPEDTDDLCDCWKALLGEYANHSS